MIAEQSNGAHSAYVNMQLLINGASYSITQMGLDFLYVKSPVGVPPGIATIVFQVDKSVSRWDVRLPNGLQPGHNRVEISSP